MTDSNAVLERLIALEQKIDEGFNGIDARFDGVDERLGTLEEKIDTGHELLVEVARGHTDSLALLVDHLGARPRRAAG